MRVLWINLWIVLAIIGCKTKAKIDPSEDKPNIVYILADDLGYGDLGCYNPDSKIKTPHVDKLASQGMLFTDAHAPAAVCTPTRYGILTGRYCWRSRLPVGVLRGYGRSLIEQKRTTVADLLKKDGYSCAVVGKWHLGLDWVLKEEYRDSISSEQNQINSVGMVTEMNADYIDFSQKPTDGPLNHGFDYSFILPASLDMDPYCFLENDVLVDLPSEYTDGNDLNTGYTGAFWRKGRIAPGFEMDQVTPTFTEKAIEFITKSSKDEKPFFLYLPFPSPHTPWVPTEEFQNISDAGLYGDFTAMVDGMVGKILDKIDALNLAENTLVIFTSDNGPFWTPELIEKYGHRAAGSLRGMKADAWEGGHRVPFIARWQGRIKESSINDQTISLTNLLSTCAEMLSIDLHANEGEDSHSIWPLLSGEGTYQSPRAFVHHSSRNYFAIRKNEWKLIMGLGSGGFSKPSIIEPLEGQPAGQLYNLNEDLSESINLYQKYTQKAEELKQIFEGFKVEGRSR